eukprot:scaffold182226_cov19-Tisochrysis_lutea.AAC.1
MEWQTLTHIHTHLKHLIQCKMTHILVVLGCSVWRGARQGRPQHSADLFPPMLDGVLQGASLDGALQEAHVLQELHLREFQARSQFSRGPTILRSSRSHSCRELALFREIPHLQGVEVLQELMLTQWLRAKALSEEAPHTVH